MVSLEAYAEMLGLQAPTLKTSPADTLKLDEVTREWITNQGIHSLPELRLHEEGTGGGPADLRVMGTLGQGGMGVVRLANQLSLDRDVAVKTLREGMGEKAAQSLLKEAYVTGYLEHPNIIPVYNVGRTAKGLPLIVMKRVEGTSWLERLSAQPSWPPTDLAAHIEILIQVANAVHFAHSRGVIHRDIKPENVMLGGYGEVYLVDWGIAVSLRKDRNLLPGLDQAGPLSGTPNYMAPEMANQALSELDERTDVYLLGATLHHVLTGRGRHMRDNVLETLFEANRSPRHDYPAAVPEELAAIANKACEPDKEKRFQSAAEFRTALQGYLGHREAVVLSDSASRKLGELHHLVRAADVDFLAIHDAYGECRFGFQQSLRLWPENKAAEAGLQECLEVMATYHLERGSEEAARACLAELPSPRPDLEARADALAGHLAEEKQTLRRLQSLERNLDLRTGAGSRSVLVIITGIIFTAASLFSALRLGSGAITEAEELRNHLLAGVRNFGIATVAVIVLRKRVLANIANRRLMYIFLAMLGTVAFFRWSVWHLGGGLLVGQIGDQIIYAVSFFAMSLLMEDRRIYWCCAGFLASAALAVFWPDGVLYGRTVATAITFGLFAWIWRPSKMKNPPA